jgi:hypothetical protein
MKSIGSSIFARMLAMALAFAPEAAEADPISDPLRRNR